MTTREPSRAGLRAAAGALNEQAFRARMVGEVYGELRRVEWPTWKQVARLTVVVILLSAIVGVFLGLLDLLLTLLINRFYLGV